MISKSKGRKEMTEKVIDVAAVKLETIKASPVALRMVNRQTEEYLGMVESIKNVGIINPVSVRRKTDTDTGEEFFELIDGLHRFILIENVVSWIKSGKILWF